MNFIFRCSRCGETVSYRTNGSPPETEEEAEAALRVVKRQHRRDGTCVPP